MLSSCCFSSIVTVQSLLPKASSFCNPYAYFLSGNYGQVHIQNQKAASKAKGKNILIIKDSFANSFVPFVTQDYENIYMVDLRYYNGDMKSYLQEHNITDVLVLYNISNFISDRNLHKLTGGI